MALKKLTTTKVRIVSHCSLVKLAMMVVMFSLQVVSGVSLKPDYMLLSS